MVLEKAIALYLQLCAVERRSPGTIRAYGQALGQFLAWLESHLDRRPTLADLNLENARLWQLSLSDPSRSLKSSTVVLYTTVLRSFATRMVAEELLVDNPLRRLAAPRAEITVPTLLSSADIALLAELAGGMPTHGRRNRAILLLLQDSGMRVAELANLKLTDLRFPGRGDTHGTIRFVGKGNKERLVGFGLVTSKALTLYLTLERQASDSPWLFPGRKAGQHLTTEAIRDVFEYLSARSGIYAHPHALRHHYGVQQTKRGTNLLALQQQLGHSDARTTKRYATLSAVDLDDVFTSIVDHPEPPKRRREQRDA